MINLLKDRLINLILLIGANVVLLQINVIEAYKLREYAFIFYVILVSIIGVALLFNNDVVKRKFLMLPIGINIMAYPVIKVYCLIAGKGQHFITISLMVLVILFILTIIMVKSGQFETETFKTLIEILNSKFKKSEMKKNSLVVAKDKITGKELTIKGNDRFLHMLILGPTGCGKTSQTIIPLSEQILDDLTAGYTVIEPKGDLAIKIAKMAEIKGRKVVYFNPADEDCPTFNPLFGEEQEVIESMVSVFGLMYKDSPSFFQDANEELLRKSILLIKRTMDNEGTFIDLYELLTGNKSKFDKFKHHHIDNYVSTYSDKSEFEKNSLLRENKSVIKYFIEYFEKDSKIYDHTSNIRTNLSKLISNRDLKKVLCPQDGKSDLNFTEHVDRIYGDNKGEQTIYALTTNQGKYKALGNYIGQFLIYSFQNAVFNRKANEDVRMNHFFFVDEVQEFVNDSMTILLNQGRSYKVASYLATQNTGLIELISPKMKSVILANCRNRVLYPALDGNDVKYFSEIYGTRKEKQISNSRTKQGISLLSRERARPQSIGKTVSEIEKNRIDANTFYEMEFGEVLVERVVNNSVSYPRVANISYIDKELNNKINSMITKDEEEVFDLT